MEKKTRSSGFIPFHTGNSTSKGRVFSEGYYQTLGKSADFLLYGDYFSLRGLAVGGVFRARPNPETRFTLEAYGIKDKLDQRGIQLTVDGESRLRNDWRAVARVNISSNFSFRQAFADSFRSATVSQSARRHFLRGITAAFPPILHLNARRLFSRSVHLSSGSFRLWNSCPWVRLWAGPLLYSASGHSLDGISRTDSAMETDRPDPKDDFYPRLTMRLPSFLGFSLMPSVGVRRPITGAAFGWRFFRHSE